MKNKIYVIGCGGGGSWLVPALCNLSSNKQLVLIDGDTLERKNLDRQLFSEGDIGKNKAEALASRYGCEARPEWFASGVLDYDIQDWLMVCVDNHAARKDALTECDRCGCRALFQANETWSAESYLYTQDWKGTSLDPRVYFPEILTDKSGDPRAAAMGCTGEAVEKTRQLVSSNMLAASLMAHMFAVWSIHAAKLKSKELKSLPYRRLVTRTGSENFMVSDLEKGQPCKA